MRQVMPHRNNIGARRRPCKPFLRLLGGVHRIRGVVAFRSEAHFTAKSRINTVISIA